MRYLHPDTLESIKRLDVRARLVVEGYVNGQHKSPYRGYAVEFAGHRIYSPGDDVRHVDWKVWSKTDRLYIKQFEEETNLQCSLFVDCSGSMQYGGSWTKFDHAATAAASLAWLLQQKQDSVSITTFHNRVLGHLPPGAQSNHLRQIAELLESVTPEEATDLPAVLPGLLDRTTRRGIVVLISDLMFPRDHLRDMIREFRMRRHEFVVFHVMHRDELTFPFHRNTLFRGLENQRTVYSEPERMRHAYLAALEQFQSEVRQVCAEAAVDYMLLDTGRALDAALSEYLSFRRKAVR